MKPFPDDSRGWIALGCFVLVLVVMAMIKFQPSLLESDFFLVLATAIVINGWNAGPVGWAYQATKGGGEAAASSARIAETAAGVPATEQPAANGASTGPQDVRVVNSKSAPANVTETKS